MMRYMLLFLLTIFCFNRVQAKQDVVPKAVDYPIAVYKGPTAKLDLSDPAARMFRTRLGDALKQPVEFAGEYVVGFWGCGAMCRSYSFVSKKTGQLLSVGFGGEENQEDVVFVKPNSRLLVTEEEVHDEDFKVTAVKVRFYEFKNKQFKLIKTLTKAPSE